MKHLLTLLLLAFSLQASAQRKPAKVQYESECPQYDYCKECGDTKAIYPGKMKRYFEKQLNFRDLDLIEGVIVVQIAIDSNGIPCVNKFYNYTTNTSEEVNRLRLPWLIGTMGKWKPAMVNGQPVNSYVKLALYSKVEDRPLFDVDYLRNDKEKKWVVNTKYEPIMVDYRAIESSLDN